MDRLATVERDLPPAAAPLRATAGGRRNPVPAGVPAAPVATNAAQALSGRLDATITIETSGDAGSVEVKICDNGPGIPPDILPRIWDPFFTTKDVGEGTGLGLSIVHELVERHGGTIECQTTVGAGTTFTVKLPRQIPLAAKARAAKSTGPLAPSRAS